MQDNSFWLITWEITVFIFKLQFKAFKLFYYVVLFFFLNKKDESSVR